ncbi:hypothetical protein [Flagellimonas sp. 2504JD4-2]
MDYELLKHLYSTTSKVLITHTDQINKNFEKADKIIIWIVGFSIGIFVLLISQKTENRLILDLTFEIYVYSLSVVILGLLFRISSFFTQIRYSTIVIELASYSEGLNNTPELNETRKIDENDSAEDVIEYLRLDFNEQVRTLETSQLSEEKKKEYRQLLINYYQALAEPKDIEKQLDSFKLDYANRFGFSKSYFDKRINNPKRTFIRGILYRVMFNLSMSLFFLTIGVFILGVAIVLKNLIENYH